MDEIQNDEMEIMIKAVDDTIVVLDREIPNWRDQIQVDIFEFVSYQNCVAGQLELFRKSGLWGSKSLDQRFIDCEGFSVPARISSPFYKCGKLVPIEYWNTMQEIWKKRLDKTLPS